jgi:2-polyprenyl-3-methyl-5-hydroxy-6-metoxy-1,4-benzoquinol methylase
MKCVVCGSDMENTNVVDVHKCKSCKHIYIDYMGDGLDYHKNEYRTNNEGNRTDNEIENGKFTYQFHNIRQGIMNKRYYAIENLIKNCSNMLDIGAGGGTFVNTIRSKSKTIDIECQEISNICVNNLKDYGYKVYHDDFNNIKFNKKYDIVTCWHVLEHIKDLKSFVNNVTQITNKFLVLEVPVDRTLRTPNGKKRWDGHYHYFSKESLHELFKNKFSSINISKPGIQSPSLTVILKK